jgi:hypothetical protein
MGYSPVSGHATVKRTMLTLALAAAAAGGITSSALQWAKVRISGGFGWNKAQV